MEGVSRDEIENLLRTEFPNQAFTALVHRLCHSIVALYNENHRLRADHIADAEKLKRRIETSEMNNRDTILLCDLIDHMLKERGE